MSCNHEFVVLTLEITNKLIDYHLFIINLPFTVINKCRITR